MVKTDYIAIIYRLVLYYPFKIPGTVVLAGSVYLLGTGIASSNAIAVSVSMFALFFILILAGITIITSRKYFTATLDWKSSGIVDSVNPGSNSQVIAVSSNKCPLFYRFRLVLKGRIKTVCSLSVFYYKTYLSGRDSVISFSYDFSAPGTASGKADLYFEDLFGFTRVKICTEIMRDFPVAPGYRKNIETDITVIRPDTIKKEKKLDNEPEKYLMREYMPGDRYRDINWKASSRINKLLTRISPGGREKAVKLSFLYISSAEDDECRNSYERFIYGKYFREFFITFLYRIKAVYPDFKFEITADSRKCIVNDGNDLRNAAEMLAYSAAESQKIKTDKSALPEIDPESSLYIFAESGSLSGRYLRLLPEENIAFICTPVFIPAAADNTAHLIKNIVPFRNTDFIYTGVIENISFYRGMAESAAARYRNKNSLISAASGVKDTKKLNAVITYAGAERGEANQ